MKKYINASSDASTVTAAINHIVSFLFIILQGIVKYPIPRFSSYFQTPSF